MSDAETVFAIMVVPTMVGSYVMSFQFVKWAMTRRARLTGQREHGRR